MDYNNPRFQPTVQRSIDILKDELKENLQSIYIFGSLARGDGKITSDVDLLVSLHEPLTRKQRFNLYDLICEEEGFVKVDLRFMVNNKLETYSKVFNEVVQREKVLLYGE